MSSEKTVSLEERFEHIEEIIEKMETGDVTLDKSFELYKSGLEEIKAANEMLDAIEKAMLVMNEDGRIVSNDL